MFISVFIVSELSSSGESVALTKPQDDSWEKKKREEKERKKAVGEAFDPLSFLSLRASIRHGVDA